MASASPNRPLKFSHQSFGSAVARLSVHTDGAGEVDRFKWVEPAPAPEPPNDDRPVASPARADRPVERSGPFADALTRADAGPAPANPADPLLDAWHASYSDWADIPPARQLVERGRAGGAGLGAMYPGMEDDRQAVPADGAPPWHGVCSLAITAADGTRWAGTGWLAGPRTVVTAGHCVYLVRHGGWARRVEVRVPGREAPVASADLRSVAGWAETLLGSADYGAVILPEPVPGPYRRPEVAPDDLFRRTSVAVVGHCTDRPPGTLWAQERTAREVQPRRLVYGRPVYGGVSGAPVLPVAGDDPGVVAVQQSGDFAGGAAVRVTEAVRANILDWVNRPDDRPPAAT